METYAKTTEGLKIIPAEVGVIKTYEALEADLIVANMELARVQAKVAEAQKRLTEATKLGVKPVVIIVPEEKPKEIIEEPLQEIIK